MGTPHPPHHPLRLATAALTLILAGVTAGCERGEQPGTGGDREAGRSSTDSTSDVSVSGGMNEWLSDGTMGLLVHGFHEDPAAPGRSVVTYHLVHFTAQNFTKEPIELYRIRVEFLTSDLTESIRASLGDPAADVLKPFAGEINWRRSLEGSPATRVTHVIDPLGTDEFKSSGHFYFGNKEPAVEITFFQRDRVAGGPFRVTLGREISIGQMRGSSGGGRPEGPGQVLRPRRQDSSDSGGLRGDAQVSISAVAFRGSYVNPVTRRTEPEYLVMMTVLNTAGRPLACDALEASFYSERGTTLRVPTTNAQDGLIILQPGEAETFDYRTDGYTADLMEHAAGGPLLFRIAIMRGGIDVVRPLSAPLPPLLDLPMEHDRPSAGRTGRPLNLR